MKRHMPVLLKCLIWGVITLILLILIWILGINSKVLHQGGSHILTDVPKENTYDAILVLGAGLQDDGSPSPMLGDRLLYAVELYHQGVAKRIVLSGDRAGEHYDEVDAMAEYCLSKGVPKEAIVRDNEGFSTFETMVNYQESGGGKVLVVTQKYHLYRALYVAQELKLDADGYPSDTREYRLRLYRELREVFARAKDVLMITLSS